MATTKRRLNISLPPELDEALTALAKRDKTPQATAAIALLRKAIEIEEDQIWDEIANSRRDTNPTYVSHNEVWG